MSTMRRRSTTPASRISPASVSTSKARRCSRSAPASGCYTPFFLERGCDVTVTDGRPENVAEIKRRLPGVKTALVDLERDESLTLGRFDLVYCFGLLYHLANPAQALGHIAAVRDGQLLLETAVSPGNFDELLLVRDPDSFNQAVSGIGLRPTRLWVLNRLKALFSHGYIPRTQPDHVDFPADWIHPPIQTMHRSIFIKSKVPLALATLDDIVPSHQETYREARPASRS